MVQARPGELVLNRQQQMKVMMQAGSDVFKDLGIPSNKMYQSGGYVPARGGDGAAQITLVFEGDAGEIAGNLMVKGMNTVTGQKAVVRVVRSSRRNGEI